MNPNAVSKVALHREGFSVNVLANEKNNLYDVRPLQLAIRLCGRFLSFLQIHCSPVVRRGSITGEGRRKGEVQSAVEGNPG